MLIAFKPNTTNSGLRGLGHAITTACTAAAGSNPAKPQYVDVWRVISDEEAGGWTVESDSLSGATSVIVGDKLRLSAPTKKLDGSVRKKYFGMRINSTNTVHYNWWNFWVRFPERTNMGTTSYSSEATNRYLSYQGATSNTTASNQSWYYNYNPHHGEWLISVTENYLYIFRPAGNGTDVVQYKSELCGVADLTGTPDNLLGSSHAYEPFVGFYHGHNVNSPSTLNDGDSLYDFLWVGNGPAYPQTISTDENYKWTENRSQFIYSNTTTGPSTNQAAMDLGPSYDGSGRTFHNTLHKTVTSSGSKIYSMHPAAVYNPFWGVPYQTIDGLKYLGNFGDANYDATMNPISNDLNFKYFYDENGDRYIANPSMGIVRLIRAM